MQSRRVSSLNMLVGEEVHLLSRQLYCAAARGHVRTLRKILLSGVDPDWYHPDDGLTCLQVAALEGRANCVHHLLLAGADMYATLSQGCTAIDFFVQQKLLVHILDKLFWTRNYKGCLECLEKADADCQRRSHATTEYQGIVVIHPSDELGLLCLPAGKALVCAGRPVCTDDSPAAQRAARPALAVAPAARRRRAAAVGAHSPGGGIPLARPSRSGSAALAPLSALLYRRREQEENTRACIQVR